MLHRISPLCLVVVAVMAVVFAPAVALADSHEGIVVKAGDGKLTMTLKDGKNEHTHDVALDATITRDGKDCKLNELKQGDKVTVTTEKKAGKEQATRIVAKSS